MAHEAREIAVDIRGRLKNFEHTIQALAIYMTDPAQDGGRRLSENAVALVEAIGERLFIIGPPPDFAMTFNSNATSPDELPRRLPNHLRDVVGDALTRLFDSRATQISGVFLAPLGGGYRIALAVPVTRGDEVAMAAGMSIASNTVAAWITRHAVRPGSYALLFDGRRNVIATTLPDGGHMVGAPVPDWLGRAAGIPDSGLLRGPGLTGTDTVMAIHRVPDTPGWTIAVAQPVEALHEDTQAALGTLPIVAVLMLGAFVVSIAVAIIEVRRRAESDMAALDRGRQEVARLHGGLPAVIFLREVTADLSSRHLYKGGDAAKVTGIDAAALERIDDLAELAVEEHANASRRLYRVVLEAGEATVEWALQRPDGSLAWMRTLARALERRPDGSALVVGYVTDVTDARRLVAQGMNAAKMATLGEMATGLAHELNQPLAVIATAAETALRRLKSAGAEGAADASVRLERIVNQALRARAIVDHLRIFGHADEGEPEPLSLLGAVEGAVSLVGNQLRLANIALVIDIPPGLPKIHARLVPVEQVLVNLLTNARDAIRGAGIDGGTITVSARETARGIELRVSDDGPGISAAVIDRVFEPFFTTKEVGKGTGLGLPICYGTMKSFGGSIVVGNRRAGGAEVTLTFPSAAATMRAAPHAFA
ncbi:sensor histidine kinase [Neoroseomonas rubea]|uniref:sensor histidine kinase n=1 Tax=Neoroseomonas rubea TaxID=2748666 RepID=UPI0018E0430C|nr:sensor histidine kinase [Roseomonas rubea]